MEFRMRFQLGRVHFDCFRVAMDDPTRTKHFAAAQHAFEETGATRYLILLRQHEPQHKIL